jgi:hypothetical protein
MLRARFDPGLLNMQAPDLESVKQVGKAQTWTVVVLSRDVNTLRRARRKRYRMLAQGRANRAHSGRAYRPPELAARPR